MSEYATNPRSDEWDADRAVESTSLPYAHRRHYEHEGERQVDLASAERSNIARAAGELGLTSTEWVDLRTQLGRSPSRSDVNRTA